MSILDFFYDVLEGLSEIEFDDDDDDYPTRYKSDGLDGRHRFVVNYVSQTGAPGGVEVIAYTTGHARDLVKCRCDVKYVTSCYEIK
jgi:hypothetical protein